MSPRVAVIASQGATELCEANHIPSVVDLLKPFGEQIEGRGKRPGQFIFFIIYLWVAKYINASPCSARLDHCSHSCFQLHGYRFEPL